MKARKVAVCLAVLLVTLGGAATLAQDAFGNAAAPSTPVEFRPAGAAPSEPEWGTASVTSVVVGAHNHSPRTSGTTWAPASGGEIFASNLMDASPMVPNGAQITKIEIEGCDTSATDALVLNFGPCGTPGAGCSLAGAVATGGAETPGCGFFATTLASPLTVSNETTYLISEVSTGNSAATTFSAVRVYYQLQVSPAPATATFPDVPTSHPFFRFVEALAAAGITGGCGSGLYCPDNPVTRGQMAVFLSLALGLHFPN